MQYSWSCSLNNNCPFCIIIVTPFSCANCTTDCDVWAVMHCFKAFGSKMFLLKWLGTILGHSSAGLPSANKSNDVRWWHHLECVVITVGHDITQNLGYWLERRCKYPSLVTYYLPLRHYTDTSDYCSNPTDWPCGAAPIFHTDSAHQYPIDLT